MSAPEQVVIFKGKYDSSLSRFPPSLHEHSSVSRESKSLKKCVAKTA